MNVTHQEPPAAATSPVAATLARFTLRASSLPSVPETLPLAEQFRRALLSKCKQLALADEPGMPDAAIWRRSPAFWAKDDAGRPRTGHEHAFFLPTDEDGDGRLDHVTLVATMGFNDLERRAIGALRRLTFGNGEPLAVELIQARSAELGARSGGDDSHSSLILHPSSLPPSQESGDRSQETAPLGALAPLREIPLPSALLPVPLLLAESREWVSSTPFIATRYPKLRGTKRDRPEDYATPRDFARHVLRQELARRRELPEVVAIDDVDVMGAGGLRPIEFERFRNKQGDDGGRRPAGAFRITFAAPVRGPLCLGHSCHFGLGLFLPAAEGK
jgi:CRISPR-associated protein Csb2